MSTPKIYVIHENSAWTAPLAEALTTIAAPFELMHAHGGVLDLQGIPPRGVYYSRMSASAHTRGHRYAPEFTAALLRWLEAHGRVVFNGSRALALEVSKVAQYLALEAHGIVTPRTVVAVSNEQILAAASSFEGPFVTKHNRGGKGLGVYKHDSLEGLERFLREGRYEEPVDGITLVQEYVTSSDRHITRCEFVDGKFLYAVRVDTAGGFELCPADVCEIGDGVCPASAPAGPKFQILDGFAHPLVPRYEKFLRHAGIAVAGIEFIVDEGGRAYTYDVNTNTNYNSAAEALAGVSGMTAIARFLLRELEASAASEPVAIAS